MKFEFCKIFWIWNTHEFRNRNKYDDERNPILKFCTARSLEFWIGFWHFDLETLNCTHESLFFTYFTHFCSSALLSQKESSEWKKLNSRGERFCSSALFSACEHQHHNNLQLTTINLQLQNDVMYWEIQLSIVFVWFEFLLRIYSEILSKTIFKFINLMTYASVTVSYGWKYLLRTVRNFKLHMTRSVK